MIKLATPISTLFNGDEAERDIVDASDCLECRDHAVKSTLPRQELFHFEAELIHPWPQDRRAFIRQAIAKKPELTLITFHAASCCSAPILEHGRYQIGGTVYTVAQMLDHARDNVAWLRSFLPQKMEIGLENNNYYPTPAYEHVTDGAFLSRIVEENNLRFLFDIAHARITAHNRKISLEQYHASLPLTKIIQVHVCRSSMDPQGMAIDAHLAPGEEEREEVESLIARYQGLRYVTLEYYKDAKELAAILGEYRKLRI